MSNEVNNNSAGDYEEYEEEINEIEEYDDVDENGEPIIEYEDDGYQDGEEYVDGEEYYDDEYPEEEGYDDEYADDEGYEEEEEGYDEEYDDGALVPADQNDDKVKHLLSELEAMRNTNLYHGSNGILQSFSLSEISRLRDETLKNNLQNQITYNNSIFNEIYRLKDDVTRNQADSRLHYEIMQLRQELKTAQQQQPSGGGGYLPQGNSGGNDGFRDEYYRNQMRSQMKDEIAALKEELKNERSERSARQDIDRLKAQIAQLQKGGGGKPGFNSGEENVGTSHPLNYNNPVANYQAGDFERVFRELNNLKQELNSRIEEIRDQNEWVMSLSKELAGKVEEIKTHSGENVLNAVRTHIDQAHEKTAKDAAEAKTLLNEIIDELSISAKMAEAKAAIVPDSLDLGAQLADIKAELKELSDMTALVKAVNSDDITSRIDAIEEDLDELVDANFGTGKDQKKPSDVMAETLTGLSVQLDKLSERISVIVEQQFVQQTAIDALATSQKEAARAAEERAVLAVQAAAEAKQTDAEAAKALAVAAAQEAAMQAAQAGATQAAQATQSVALAEISSIAANINDLRTEILSVTSDQSQAITQYMQYFANEVSTLKTEIKTDMDTQAQSMNTAIRTVSEPRIQQASAGLDADMAEALNAVLNDIKLNIHQNQEAVNSSLHQNLENIKALLSDRSDTAAAAVERAALMDAVNDLRSAVYGNIDSVTNSNSEITANDISEILNEINLLRQDVVRQTVEPNTAPSSDSLFLEQFGAAVMADFDYLKEEIRLLAAADDQSAMLQVIAEEFNSLKEQMAASQNSTDTEVILSEIERLKSAVIEQNSIADAQAAESASQAEAISAIREAIASLPDEMRLTVAGIPQNNNSTAIEQLTTEISVLKTMLEEQTRQLPTTAELDNLAGQINSIRVLIGENPALATDYNALNNLSNEIGSLRAFMERIDSREIPDASAALENLSQELGAVKALLETRESNEMYVEFTAAMEELRAELAAHTERTTENYNEILSAASATLAAAEQAAQAAQNHPVQEFDTTTLTENISALRDELSNRLVPDTFVIMDSLKDFRTELEANLAERDAERTEIINGQLAQLGRDVYEYTAPGKNEIDAEFTEYVKKELKTAKDAILYSIYRDNVYSENMAQDLAYLGDQLYYISENMVDGFALTAGDTKNKDLLLEISRYIDTLRHDMTNRVMQDADAFNTVSSTLRDLQNELRLIQSDHGKTIAALNKENAATLKETMSTLKSEFKETYGALKLDHNTVLANILNTLKSLRSDLVSEVVKGRDIDDRKVLQELSAIKGEIAAARSKGLVATTERSVSGSSVTIEDLKNELSGIAEIVKNNKKSKTTTTTTTRKSGTATARKTSGARSGGGSSRTRSVSASQTTGKSLSGKEDIVETTVTTTETVNDEQGSSMQQQSYTAQQTSQFREMSAAEINEVYEYDGQKYTREQLQLAQALAAKIADKMIVEKLAEQLNEPTVLTIAEEMVKNRLNGKKDDENK